MYWLPKLLGKRISVTVHGFDHQRAKWGDSLAVISVVKNAVRFVDEIIALSQGVMNYFKNTNGRDTKFYFKWCSKKAEPSC